MYGYGKPDKTQAKIVEELRQIGAKVRITSGMGDDFPDLLVLFRGTLILMEVKSKNGRLTTGQELFFKEWHEATVVVRTPKEALQAIGAI